VNSINLPPGTRSILTVTLDNDENGAFSHSYAILACVTMSNKLIEISKAASNQDTKLLELLDVKEIPETFLTLTASLLKKIHNTINDLIRKAGSTGSLPLVSDYDKYVLSALGLSLSELLWTEKNTSEFSGPPTRECMRRLSQLDQTALLRTFTKHLVGNIIQHYFEKADVRRSVPDLPADEEERIREQDAVLISNYCIDLVLSTKGPSFNVFDYMDSFKKTLTTATQETDDEV